MLMQAGAAVLFILVVLVVIASRRGAPSLGPALVLQEFYVDDLATEGKIIQIRGRVSGIIAWVFTKVGIDTETTLMVTTDRFSLHRASLSGRGVDQVPLSTIASTHSAYYQPVWALFLGGFWLIAGLVGVVLNDGQQRGEKAEILLGSIVVAVVFGAVFVLGRKIGISIETSGGRMLGVAFKPSVIEGVSVTMDNALRVAAVLNTHVIRASNSRHAPFRNPVAQPPTTGRPSPASRAADDGEVS